MKKNTIIPYLFLSLQLLLPSSVTSFVDTSSWFGSEYTPAGASNTEWWSFYDNYVPAIQRELQYASSRFKMNTLRIFLHTTVYECNSTQFLNNIDNFLSIASDYGFKAGLVFFDTCWNEEGNYCQQECVPTKGVHNGCWTYSPVVSQMNNSVDYFYPYVSDIMQRFAMDDRIAFFEVYNEPRGPNTEFTFALRDAGYRWATSYSPLAPVISCWDDNNDTMIVDHHDYTDTFTTSWTPAIYSNLSKGAVITEGGSRWYQPPFPGDYGSPLIVLNYLEALRIQKAQGQVPFTPGAIMNWEVMVGNSNTRWHWNSPVNASEPAIPWDGWMFPNGSPVSYTEAAAARRYMTGEDEFLSFSKFLTVPPIVEDGDAFLVMDPGTSWIAPLNNNLSSINDALIEASVWLVQGGSMSMMVRANNLPSKLNYRTRIGRSYTSLPSYTKNRSAPVNATVSTLNTDDSTTTCTYGPIMNNTDVCSGGPPGYRDMSVANQPDPLGYCAAACCAWSECTAWIVRNFTGTDNNCTNELCCWLKPYCGVNQTTPFDGAISQYIVQPPGPPLPIGLTGYNITLDTVTDTLTVIREDTNNTREILGTFNLTSLENGLVRSAWNILRVLMITNEQGTLTLQIFFNPMYPETGFVGDSSDAFRTPLSFVPRILVQDTVPLPAGSIVVSGGFEIGQVDYVSALPVSVF